MKRIFSTIALFAVVAAMAADVPVQGFLNPRSWRRTRSKDFYSICEKTAAVKFNAPSTSSFYSVNYPIADCDENKCFEGISFEVKGDGSSEWGTIAVFETNLVCGQFYFPVSNKEWKEYRVAFADMTPASGLSLGLPASLPVKRITNLNFGDRWKLNWTNIKRNPFTYEVRNVKLIEKIDSVFVAGKYKSARPLADVVKEMKAGKKVLVSCFGDSITAGTALKRTDKRYATLVGEMLVKKFNNGNIKSECVAIGGAHTYDSLGWLQRDLTKGNPDVATMLIGYNNRSGGQSAELYRAQLEMWIERLLTKTNGKTAIILIPSIQGVPRWDAQKDMAEMTYKVAKKYNCTICPIEQVIEKIGSKEYLKKYLADAIHPNQAGHIIFAQELVKCFDK